MKKNPKRVDDICKQKLGHEKHVLVIQMSDILTVILSGISKYTNSPILRTISYYETKPVSIRQRRKKSQIRDMICGLDKKLIFIEI